MRPRSRHGDAIRDLAQFERRDVVGRAIAEVVAGVEAPFAHALERLAGYLVRDRKLEPRMHSKRRRQHATQPDGLGIAHSADTQGARDLPGHPRGGVPECIGRGQGFERARQQLPAGGGEDHAARRTLEQLEFEKRLERLDLPAEGRLADVKALGSPGQMAEFGHRDKGSDLVELHGTSTACLP